VLLKRAIAECNVIFQDLRSKPVSKFSLDVPTRRNLWLTKNRVCCIFPPFVLVPFRDSGASKMSYTDAVIASPRSASFGAIYHRRRRLDIGRIPRTRDTLLAKLDHQIERCHDTLCSFRCWVQSSQRSVIDSALDKPLVRVVSTACSTHDGVYVSSSDVLMPLTNYLIQSAILLSKFAVLEQSSFDRTTSLHE